MSVTALHTSPLVSQGPPQRPALTQNEWRWAAVVLVAGLTLRVAYVFICNFNSDEPQHLHVARAWAHGQMQYRDVFDNHTPVFHMLMSPFVRLIGDRYDLLIWMRLIMVPIYALTLWCAFLIGRKVLPPRQAVWAAVLTAAFFPFLKESTEFRTDDLWALLFVAAIAAGMSASPLRFFAAGFLLGAAISVSMKTSLLLFTLGVAGTATWLVCLGVYPARPAKNILANTAFALSGFILLPAVVILWFSAHGALHDLYYGAIGHNLLPGLGKPAVLKKILYAPVLAAVLILARQGIVKRALFGDVTPRYCFLFVLSAVYSANFLLLWPLATDQNFLPIWPIVMIVAVPFLDRSFDRARCPFAGLAMFSLIELLVVLALGRNYLLKGTLQDDLATWKAVLALTDPQDYVMDPKGELIFRDRAFYWGFETITIARMRRGLIPETVNDSLIATHTCVVYPKLERYPNATRAFIESNYVSVGPVLVAGKHLVSTVAATPIAFTVAIPAEYVVLTTHGPGQGRLDDQPLSAQIRLDAGRHEYFPAQGEDRAILLWAKAKDLGYLPVELQQVSN